MINNIKYIKRIYILLIAFVLIMPLVCAIGFSKPEFYNVGPGETKNIQVYLSSSTTDYNNGKYDIELKLIDGKGVASLVDKSSVYSVTPGKDAIVNIKISIPEGTLEDTVYDLPIELQMTNVPKEKTGSVSFDLKMSGYVKVIVKKPTEVQVEQPVTPSTEKGNNLIWTVILVIVLAVIVVAYFLYGKKPGKKK